MPDVTLPSVPLGSQGMRVSSQALGTLSINEFYGSAAPDDDEVREGLATIHRALDLGVTFFDTADIYGNGENERMLGRELAAVREDVVIATKFGSIREPGATSHEFVGRPEYVRRACEASLLRLGIDYVDLYYQHRADDRVPIEETVGAMAELVAEGKVLYLGLSESASTTIRRAAAVHPITAVQSEYSLFSRDIETEVIPTCRELGIGVVAYSPLGRGLLTGTVTAETSFAETDWRRSSHPRFSDANLRANATHVDRIRTIGLRHGATPSQVALAWLHHQGPDIIPLPGTKRRTYLEQNVAAAGLALTPEDLRELDAIEPAGQRYGDMSVVHRTTPPIR